MLALFLEEVGRLDEDTRGAGGGRRRRADRVLARQPVGRVVATDIYGEGDFAGAGGRATRCSTDPRLARAVPLSRGPARGAAGWTAASSTSPTRASTWSSRSRRSSTSARRPTSRARPPRSGRVLRPGGHAFVVTECLVQAASRSTGPPVELRAPARDARPPAAAGPRCAGASTSARRSPPRELERRIVRPSGLRLMQPLDTTAVGRVVGQPRALPARAGRRSEPRSGSFYPHILVQTSRSVFTSACLPLQKPL